MDAGGIALRPDSGSGLPVVYAFRQFGAAGGQDQEALAGEGENGAGVGVL